MSSQEFKEQISKDREIFLNPAEFGENLRLRYKIGSDVYEYETVGIITYGTRSKSIAESKTIKGLYTGTVKMFIKTHSKIPRQGQTIHVNDVLYTVLNSTEQEGIQILILEGYKQR